MDEDETRGGREIVIPGDLLDDSGRVKPGNFTYARGGRIYAARLGVRSDRQGVVSIVPLSGVYNPVPGDVVIGIVAELGPSNWLMDINAPYPAPMHVNEVPWKVEFAETAKYLNAGDAILCKILFVDESKKVQVTMQDRNLRKLTGGHMIDVNPSKVPRVIGKGGSMINLIKDFCEVWLFVGQNGRIWLNGEPESIARAIDAIRKVEREAHTTGLTDRMKEYLMQVTGKTHAKPMEGMAPS